MNSNNANLDLGHSVERRFERASSLTEKDMDSLWKICGRDGTHTDEFEEAVRHAVLYYFPGPQRTPAFTAKDRARYYAKLEKTVASLRSQLENVDDQIVNEIDWSGEAFGPENFDTTLAADYGMFSYGGYLFQRLHEDLEVFANIVSSSVADHVPSRGKPKQNGALESTIQDLGDIYETCSGSKPMDGYRYDDLDDLQPYKGSFFDFLHTVFWTVNGTRYPSSNTIGDAARRLYKLRK